MRFSILSILNLFLIYSSFGGEIEINGVYQGKNVFVQNPYNVDKKEFCTKEVYLNDQKILSSVKNSAYAINLSNLEIGSPVNIKIIYNDDCAPRIINPYVLQNSEKYTIENLAVTEKDINWSIREDVLSGRFIVEKYTENYWKPITTTPVTINEKVYKASIGSFLTNGNNKFRIKYLSPKEQVFISQNIEHDVALELTSIAKEESDMLLLSKETTYEIIDQDGNKIKDGRGKEIAISNLNPGVYYINYDNRSEKFLKK
jgi:hypothetical protein